MSETAISILLHIFEMRAKTSKEDSVWGAWDTALTCLKYALDDNIECLTQFDYIEDCDDEETYEDYLYETFNDYLDEGFDPYLGEYTYDC